MTSRVYSYEGLSDEGKKRYRAKLDFVGPDVVDLYTLPFPQPHIAALLFV